MPQSRLFFSADKTEAERIYDIIEQAFEDEAFPIAITEIDGRARTTTWTVLWRSSLISAAVIRT